MRDPLIVIADLGLPAYNRAAKLWEWINFATLWHKDPETDKTDDSCGWSSPKLTAEEKEWAAGLITNEHDNIKYIFGDARTGIGSNGVPYIEYLEDRDMIQVCSIAMRRFKRNTRKWYQHPRWHLHHWHFSWHWRYFFSAYWQTWRRKPAPAGPYSGHFTGTAKGDLQSHDY